MIIKVKVLFNTVNFVVKNKELCVYCLFQLGYWKHTWECIEGPMPC